MTFSLGREFDFFLNKWSDRQVIDLLIVAIIYYVVKEKIIFLSEKRNWHNVLFLGLNWFGA